MAESVVPTQQFDCSEVDIQEVEQLTMHVAETVQNMAMNVDITNLQFDTHSLYEEAQKLGLDAGDLEDYGFEPKGKCSNSACIDREKIKNFADYLDNMGRFQTKMEEKGGELMQKVQCHPKIKNSPSVQFIQNMCPIPIFICGLNPCINLLLVPLCPCIQIPWDLYITIPWNNLMSLTFWYSIAGWAAPIFMGLGLWGLLAPK